MFQWKRMRQYKVYRKLIVSYILLVTLTVSLVCSLLFYVFSSNAVKEKDRQAKTLLTQISYASDVVNNQIINIGNEMINDHTVISYFNEDDDKIRNYEIFRQLSKIQAIYPFIKSIGIYKPANGSLLDTAGIPVDTEALAQNTKKYMSFYPRKVTVEGANGNMPYSLITFVLYPDFSMTSPSKSVIYMNMDEQYILNTIRNISKIDHDVNTFVMNTQGQVLSHTDSSLFLQDLSGESYIKRILSEQQDEHSFIAEIENQKQLVTYVKSEGLNWYFVSVNPYNQIVANIIELRNITLLTGLLLVLVGFVISLYLTRTIHNPIKSLIGGVAQVNESAGTYSKLDEYQILADAFSQYKENEESMKFNLHKSSRAIKETYLLHLFKGSMAETFAPEEWIQRIEDELAGPFYAVVVFKIDNFAKFKEREDLKDQALIRFAICNIAQEIMQQRGQADLLVTEENEIAMLKPYAKEETQRELPAVVADIQSVVKSYFKLSISAGIGDTVGARGAVHLSYKSAQQYVKFRLFYGHECILDAKRTKQHFMVTVKYPYALEKQLTEAVMLCNEAAIKKKLGEFVQHLSAGTYYQGVNYCSQLMISLFKHFEQTRSLPETNFNQYLEKISEIHSSETIEDITQIITDFLFKVCAALEEKNNHANAQKYKSLIEEVQKYIRKQYTNPGLSLEVVADVVGLSPGYLGKLFKGNTQMSFNEYVNKVRLEKAKELLSTTSEPASRICETVGIYNVTYFSTLFKKNFSMTPSQYREWAAGRRSSGEPE
ncbi:HTH-type transcriptional regulator YesS [Paenibacillus solanacearum]|uniref:HTH-type transcriptional regulator YesS n=1 Tax=Paenibacillus solanacearum TaxID=2048548 RepID=A0A916K3G2_9BACL|nr:helix-turn-helix domain-containing protein [Paenibacillus solanacearum]CAG7623243.1 HTH-type transcriptional regulator YesS [Paenibacillus solanacearum]